MGGSGWGLSQTASQSPCVHGVYRHACAMLDTGRTEGKLGSQLSPSWCESWGLTSALHLFIDKWIDFETWSQTHYID